MSLTALINSAVGSALDAIGDLKTSAVASYGAFKVFDINTQKNEYNYKTDNIELVQYDFSSQERLSEGVNDNDYKFLVKVSELSQGIESYEFITVGSQKWDIVNIILKECSNSVVTYHVSLSSA